MVPLPPEVWDLVLVHGGPLCLATDRVGVARARLQRAVRSFLRRVAPEWREGMRVAYAFPRVREWETGTLFRLGDGWVVERTESSLRGKYYVFLMDDARRRVRVRRSFF
jgi:hypothetical protein